MTEDQISPELLSAYVDGELAADEAAVIARRAARDPALARQLATLQELRAGVAAIADNVVLPRQPPAARRHAPWPRRLTAAAVLGVMVAGAGWWALERVTAPHGDAGATLAGMVESHDAWRDSPTQALLPAGIASARTTALMAATGLELVHEEIVGLPDGRTARHSGYLGSNGCRVSLFELPGSDGRASLSTLAFAENDDLLHASWQTVETRYVLLARKMDSVRFATIASSVRAATQSAVEDENDLIAALEGARQRCLA